MGKVIKKKLNGMSWWMKTSLVLLLTLATSVFMYEGWYKPKAAAAATLTYYMQSDTTSNVGVDGTCNLPAGTPAATQAAPLYTTLGTAESGVAARYYAPVVTNSTVLKMYGPVYATDMDISNISASFAVRPAANADWIRLYLYDYDPAGAAGNKTLVATSTQQTEGTAGTTVTKSWSAANFTISGTGRVAQGHRLLVEVVLNTTVAQSRVYCGVAGALTSSNITLTETPVATNGAIQLSAATNSVAEGAGFVTITATRTGGSTGAVGISYATSNGTATSGSDYTTTSGTLSWADGDVANKTFNVPILQDTLDEPNETFTVTLSTPTGGATLGATSASTVTITDDDTVPTVQFQAASSSGNEGTTPAAITVTLSAASGNAVNVNYVTAAGTATAGSDFTTTSGTLTIPALSTTGTINVPIINDVLTETPETFTVTLSVPVNATLGATTVHTFTITDNDGPPSTITTCGGCHGYTTTFNDGASRNDAGKFQGSHNNHVIGSVMACATCHISPTPADSTNFGHSTGSISMAATISSGTYTRVSPIPVSNTFTPGTCNNTTCHGSVSPTWGNNTTNNQCTKCHGTPTAGAATDLQKAPTTPAVAAHAVHLSASIGASVACAECHQNVATIGAAGHMDGVKTIQYNGPVGSAQTTTPAGNNVASCYSTWCHGGNTTLIPANKGTLRTNPVWGTTFGTTSALGDALGVSSTNTGTGRCAKCHGFPPATASHSGTSLAGAKTCNSCHSNLTTAGTFTDKSLHVNGIIEGGSCTGCHDAGGSGLGADRLAITPQFGTGYSHHYQGAAAVDGNVCYACHWESDATGGTTGYHTGAAGGTVDLVIWTTTSRPVTWSTTATATATAYLSGGATASSRTEMAKINNHCLGCHGDLNKTITPFSASGDTKTPSTYSWEAKPTTAGGLGAAASIGAKYLSTATTPWGKFTGNFTNSKNTQTKAYSAHGNATANARGWNTLAETTQGTAVISNYPNTSGTGQVLCFDCHNSHGSDISTVAATTSYDSVVAKKGGILKRTTAGKGGYVAAYGPASAGSTAEKNVYNAGAGLCFDCHNNAAAAASDAGGGTTPWGYNATYGASQAIYGYNDTPYFGNSGGTFAKNLTYTYTGLTSSTQGNMKLNKGGHFGASTTLINTPDAAHQIGGLCTPCHDPHGVSAGISTPANAVPLLKGTFVTSPYKTDAAGPSIVRGGGSDGTALTAGAGAGATGFVPGYHIDQNTMQTNRPMKATTQQSSWVFATSAKSLQTFNSTQFAGLCTNCHTQATLNGTAAATSANWKTSGRIHNSVAGWAATGGGNANNTKHAFTCSKCHATHNSRLPRLLVTNCLDVKHAGRVLSIANPSVSTTLTITPYTGSAGGRGRFPGGGGGAANIATASNPGPWYFGNTASGTAAPTAATTCHESATAGTTTFNPASQRWNTKSQW